MKHSLTVQEFLQACHRSILKNLKIKKANRHRSWTKLKDEQHRYPLSLTLLLTEQRDSSPSGGNEGQEAKTTLFDQFSTKERRIGIKLAKRQQAGKKYIYFLPHHRSRHDI